MINDKPVGPVLFQYVDAPSFSAKPFIVLGDECVTYGELRDLMARTAKLFAACNIGANDRVVICSQNDLAVVTLYLSAMRIGVTPALIDPNSSIDEATALVRAARARALFVDERLAKVDQISADLLPGGRVFRVCRDRFMSTPPAQAAGASSDEYPGVLGEPGTGIALPSSVPESTSAFILFTSGTTSRPKGVEVSLGAVTAHMQTMHRQYGYDEQSIVINGLPLHHSDGINHGPVNIMAAGGTLYRSGAFSVQQLPRILEMISTRNVTHMITVPTVLALIARMGSEYTNAFRTPSFRFVSSTAGPLDERLWRAFEDRFGTMVVNAYGLTETVCEGFYCGPTPQTRRIGTIGKPVDIAARIIRVDGSDAAPGEMGELILRGSCVMKGYFAAPQETAEVLRDGWLYTGDLAVCDADGFYSITGRKKNVIITGGINVYPEDVSRTLERMPGIREAVTVGVPDETWGERVVSCIVTEAPALPTGEQAIEYCREHMSLEKVPSSVFSLQQLPRGPSGKIALPEVKRLVLDLLAQLADSPLARPVGSDDAVAARVFALAAKSFNTPVAELSVDSEPETTDGWSSLAHMDFLLALESAFGIKMAPGDMLSIMTLGDAVDYIGAQMVKRSEGGTTLK
jgi:long-chain acyl-CoA synthetase